MDNEFQTIGLYDHNAASYRKIKEAFTKEDIVAIVHATGTGKSYNALQLAYDNPNKKIVYVVPSNSISEHIEKILNDNPNIDIEKDFPNLDFRTYQSFVNMSLEEISQMNINLLILDEFHHIGAPVWGTRINNIIETHPNIKVFGMTAYTVRDRGTPHERDMADPDGNELFSNKVVSRYDLCDAMVDGVLPKPIYKSAYIKLLGVAQNLEEKVQKLNKSSRDYQELISILNDVKKRIHEAPSIGDVVKKNLKRDGKYIYFCPPYSEEGVNDINTIMQEAKRWALEMGLKEDEIEFYQTTSDMGVDGKKNRDAFYNDTDLEGNKVDNKLRIMFAINQYNEGVHAPNIDGVILGRGTASDIIYFEQLGRALSVRGNTKEKFDEYEKLSMEELLELCRKRDIIVKKDAQKEEIIEKLLSPVIIDLTNNFEFIKELENNLKDRIKQVSILKSIGERESKIKDASFDIEIVNQDLFAMLKYVSDRLIRTWEECYEYAKIYYEHHGNLEVPSKFKTTNGYEYDENGIMNLGNWIVRQRVDVSTGSKRWEKLNQIGMRFENKRNIMPWEEWYKYAKIYYEHHGNLEVPNKFKTTNGYEYDENGIMNLGIWISNQRKSISPGSKRWEMLNQIGMRFENKNNIRTWEEWYKYAKIYYEHHGNLEISSRFKTTNGYEYDKNGTIKLGAWILGQREYISPGSKRWEMLNQIGMRFERNKSSMSWEEWYKYAKIYYEYHGNLEVSSKFKTTNGYEYDENGTIKLGAWIFNQREKILPESEKGKLLSQIGMRFEKKINTMPWEEWYKYAKIYYEHHGNLEVPIYFKTTNGYEYDENGTIKLGVWISTQRGKVSPGSKRWEMLNQIGMRFENKINTMPWEEWYKYAKIYYEHHGNLEVSRNFKTTNGYEYDENGIINLGNWIIAQRHIISPGSKRWEMLNQIGMRFENNKFSMPWEKWYEYAKIYYEHHGNLEVPQKFKTTNGYEYDENGMINLGNWIRAQRKKILPESEKGKLLSQIGMRFENKKNTMPWEEWYEYAKIYYEHHGNLEVPSKFKTTNGYEYANNGIINLGIWIFRQRDNVAPGSKRWEMLNQIGMIWNVRKNREEVSYLCNQYNIDYNINKIILSHISIQELSAKINYLEEKGISITDEKGTLHEIFLMSNINMQAKYNISLEILINDYYVHKGPETR